MQSINSLFIAPAARDWLTNSCYPRILHVFDHVCNLVNERREVLSIVTQQMGDGPFNLVIEDDIFFPQHLNAQAPISIRAQQLTLEDLTINTDNAKLWRPCPDWETLHNRKEMILNQLASLPFTDYKPLLPKALLSGLSRALALADLPSAISSSQRLAGLGHGLTPAGDDFILGASYAVWIIHPPEIAGILAKEITNTAAPLTSSLSSAWLQSAGRAEAGILWHNLFTALISADRIAVNGSLEKLVAVGHSSGRDAFAGFISLFVRIAILTDREDR